MNNLDKYKDELNQLIKQGGELYEDLNKNKDSANKFNYSFQDWYSEAQIVIKQIIPDRWEEFTELYAGDKRKTITTATFSIKDWLRGIRSAKDLYSGGKKFDDHGVAVMRFQNQITILRSAKKRFESSLFDIKQLVQADLLDSELDSAEALNRAGFSRAAGAIAGVVIESHLHQVCKNHDIRIAKKNPGINDLAQLLKDQGVIDTPEWRRVQHLADIRNLCDHKKTKDPTKDQISDLIEGTMKLTKTLF